MKIESIQEAWEKCTDEQDIIIFAKYFTDKLIEAAKAAEELKEKE